MMSAIKGGGGSGKVDNSTDKLHDHTCDKGGASKNPKLLRTSLMEAPLAPAKLAYKAYHFSWLTKLMQRNQLIQHQILFACFGETPL